MWTLCELAPLHGISSGTQKPLHDKTMSRQLQVLTKHPGFQRREHSAVKLRGAIIEKARVRRLIDKAERRSVDKWREEFVVLVGDHNGDDDDDDDDDDEDGDDSPLSLFINLLCCCCGAVCKLTLSCDVLCCGVQ